MLITVRFGYVGVTKDGQVALMRGLRDAGQGDV